MALDVSDSVASMARERQASARAAAAPRRRAIWSQEEKLKLHMDPCCEFLK